MTSHTLTLTPSFCGARCVVELDLEIYDEGLDWEVERAVLTEIAGKTPDGGYADLDPSETASELYDLIADYIPRLVAEARAEVAEYMADARREDAA